MRRPAFVNERNFRKLVRYLLGGVFLFSGAAKLIDPSGLTAQLDSLNLWTETGVTAIGYGLILFEIVLGIFILVRLNRKVLFTTIATLSVFCCFLAYKILTHDHSTCGCFGSIIVQTNKQELTNNIVMLMALTYLK